MDGLLDGQLQAALAQARGSEPTARAARTPDEAARVAEEFEAVFLAQMLEQMMPESDGPFSGGPGETAFRGMLHEEYAKVLAKSGGIGLADALAREMLTLQEKDAEA